MWQRVLRLLTNLGGGSLSLTLSSLGTLFILCIARGAGFLEGAELRSLDLLLRWRPPEAADERITILEFTEDDIQALETYPVPDKVIYRLLRDLQQYNPRVIGLDIFRDLPVSSSLQEDAQTAYLANQTLLSHLRTATNVVTIEKILNGAVPPPPGVPADNIGFADALLDDDGFVRRSLLASPASTQQTYHLSFTIQLATKYLAVEGISLNNGVRDPSTMRFGDTELFRMQADSGGYVSHGTGNNPVILINFRRGTNPFNRLSFSQFQSGAFPEAWLTDRIVIIGMTATSTKDYLNSAAINRTNPGLVPGVVFQAHAVSQIISAVLDERPILKTWPFHWEYLYIIGSGLLGLALVHLREELFPTVGIFVAVGFALVSISYSSIFIGFWLPLLPAVIVYSINGVCTIFYRVYQREQDLKIRLDERQRVIQRSYNTIHNGPLQLLKGLIRKTAAEETLLANYDLKTELNEIDCALRNVYEFMQREYLNLQSQIYLTENQVIDLNAPLHELLHQIYRNKLNASAGYLGDVKIKVTDFQPIDDTTLCLDAKANIVRFLEEALCNIEQHAAGVTRLTIKCISEDGRNLLHIADNGCGCGNQNTHVHKPIRGRGTRHARALARRLQGQFSRCALSPQGTICELTWPSRLPSSIWYLVQRWIQKATCTLRWRKE